MGLIGGGPTFMGTAVGARLHLRRVSVIFLTLAAGSIVYVVLQLVMLAGKSPGANCPLLPGSFSA